MRQHYSILDFQLLDELVLRDRSRSQVVGIELSCVLDGTLKVCHPHRGEVGVRPEDVVLLHRNGRALTPDDCSILAALGEADRGRPPGEYVIVDEIVPHDPDILAALMKVARASDPEKG